MSRFGGDPGPPALSGEHRIAAWAPGSEIRFEKPLSPAFFIRLPLTLMVFAGPAMWIAMGRRAEPDLAGQVIVSAVVALAGLWLGLSNLSGALLALPERITFDWRSGRLRVAGLRRSLDIPLTDITAIEVKGVKVAFSRRVASDMDMGSTLRYKCRLRAHYRPSAKEPTGILHVTETEFATEDPAAPVREASTVAEELATALRVRWFVTDY